METLLGSSASFSRFLPVSDPSVLVIEPRPAFMKSIPRALLGIMPNMIVDVCDSREQGLSKLNIGRYHVMISDVRLAEADQYGLLKCAQDLPCSVPVLLSAKAGDAPAVMGALAHGAVDIIPCTSREVEIGAIKPALWLYQLRLTMYNRRQRLEALRERQAGRSGRTLSERANALLENSIRDVEETNALYEHAIDQMELSLRVLEDVSRQIESQARDCALRMVRLLDTEGSSPETH